MGTKGVNKGGIVQMELKEIVLGLCRVYGVGICDIEGVYGELFRMLGEQMRGIDMCNDKVESLRIKGLGLWYIKAGRKKMYWNLRLKKILNSRDIYRGEMEKVERYTDAEIRSDRLLGRELRNRMLRRVDRESRSMQEGVGRR